MMRAGRDKRTGFDDAVKLVHDGDVLALGGMTLYRRPMAFVRALLQCEASPRGLTLLGFTGALGGDLLIGAGMVNRVRCCYFGLEAFGLAPMFTKQATAGHIQVIEETEASLALGMRATLSDVSFLPGQGWIGTDLLRIRPDIKLVDDPYGPGQFVAFPAIHCDVAVIHALRADWSGNAQIGRNLCADPELGLMSQRVIVTAEEVVEHLDGQIDITDLRVDAVVHAPRGAWPTSCYPLYALDGEEIMRYSESCPDGFADYLQSFVAPTPNGNIETR